jgi:beta-N-acetylhexosaminidase
MKYLFVLYLLLIYFNCLAQVKTDSLDIKIGQMIMIGIGERTIIRDSDPILDELSAGKIGGIVLFEKNLATSNTANSLKSLVKTLQRQATTPLFISIDEEGGKVHRLKEKYGFFSIPSAAHIGNQRNRDSTLYYYRKLSALLHSLGFNLNYAPSVDLAINPKNTVIVKAGRSYGIAPELVAMQAAMCIEAHHENRVLTTLKHFPGHGSSTSDSHFGVADITDTWQRKELVPYSMLIKSGLCDAIMVAHTVNRKLDSSSLPATLSYNVVSELLRGALGFKGVVISDDMQMAAIGKSYGLERAVLLAINSGVDILMFANTIPERSGQVSATRVHAIIRALVDKNSISKDRIDESYARIMALKKRL